MILRSPTGDENGNSQHSISLDTLTPIQPSPVEGEGSAPPLDGVDTGGVTKHQPHFRRSFPLTAVQLTAFLSPWQEFRDRLFMRDEPGIAHSGALCRIPGALSRRA